MTLAETLNKEACSCGLEEGRTWFTDSNGNTPKTVGEYRMMRGKNGVRVERENDGWAVEALGPDGKTHWALYDCDYYWNDLT